MTSHFGGAWEWLICSVRRVLSEIAPETTFSEEGLSTFFVEVKSILNSRPLTPFSFVDTLHWPLTPKDLLLFLVEKGLPHTETEKSENVFCNRWRHVQRCAYMFWKRWLKEYLSTINCRRKWCDKRRNVTENDVILVDDNTPRCQWPLGRIVKVFLGYQDLVRSVLVKTKTGELKRSISKVCVIVRVETRDDIPSWLSKLGN